MIEMVALILFLAVVLAMIAGPESKVRVTRTETTRTAPAEPLVEPSGAQTA